MIIGVRPETLFSGKIRLETTLTLKSRYDVYSTGANNFRKDSKVNCSILTSTDTTFETLRQIVEEGVCESVETKK